MEPKYPCFLNSDNKIKRSKVVDWKPPSGKATTQNEEGAQQSGAGTSKSYVFVSFTGEHIHHGLRDEHPSEFGKHAARSIRVSAH